MELVNRKRYIVVDTTTNRVLCGLRQNRRFKSVSDLGRADVCTFNSEKTARSALDRMCIENAVYDESIHKIVAVTEILRTEE